MWRSGAILKCALGRAVGPLQASQKAFELRRTVWSFGRGQYLDAKHGEQGRPETNYPHKGCSSAPTCDESGIESGLILVSCQPNRGSSFETRGASLSKGPDSRWRNMLNHQGRRTPLHSRPLTMLAWTRRIWRTAAFTAEMRCRPERFPFGAARNVRDPIGLVVIHPRPESLWY